MLTSLILFLLGDNFSNLNNTQNPTAMRILSIIILLFVFQNISFSQTGFATDDPRYKPLVMGALENLKSMDYDSCVIKFKEAFTIKQTSFLSTMRNCACAHSAGDVSYRDEQLKIAFDLNWGGSKNVFDNYPEFEYLKGTEFENLVKENYVAYAKASGVNLELMEEFETIRFEDQRYRREMNDVEKKYGWKSPQMDSLWTLQNRADSLNTSRIIELMDKMGYPGKSVVGDGHASTAFLVIQHADLEIQEKYLPMISAAADKEEVPWRSVALLVDRVEMRNERPQIYGSQVSRHPKTNEFYFSEIQNPIQIDSIRATVGLGAIQGYADNWEFKWDPERHVKINKEVKAINALKEEEEK